jgi:hypothetical protein
MKMIRRIMLFLTFSLSIGSLSEVASADLPRVEMYILEEYSKGYDRNLFRHWIDADNNGCDTRREVLISESKTKVKVGKNCKISGGKWISAYDDKTIKGSGTGVDIDHLVPLAEAWRSGAWRWTPEEREYFANDLKDERVLIAVSASSNRSKGDRDPSNWLPKVSKGQICEYVLSWVAVKLRYSLTTDPVEAESIREITEKDVDCSRRAQSFEFKPLINWEKYKPEASADSEEEVNPSPSKTNLISPTPIPSPNLTKVVPIKYKNCTEAKAAGVTPIYRDTNPELYELNKGLDRDKDGDACE